jgi:hypothetical protein
MLDKALFLLKSKLVKTEIILTLFNPSIELM